jgi:hypothetical protein
MDEDTPYWALAGNSLIHHNGRAPGSGACPGRRERSAFWGEYAYPLYGQWNDLYLRRDAGAGIHGGRGFCNKTNSELLLDGFRTA